MSGRIKVFSPDGMVNSTVIKGLWGTVVVDTQANLKTGRNLAEFASKAAGSDPVLFVINTHEHFDHIAGNQFFKAPVVASEDAKEAILNTSSSEDGFLLTPPSVAFEKRLTIFLGDLTLHLTKVGGHSPGQIVLFIPEVSTLITGDLVFNGRSPYLGKTGIPEWTSALTSLYSLDPTTVVPGHGETGGKEILLKQREWLEVFMDKSLQGKRSGLSPEETCKMIMESMELPEERKPVFLAAVSGLYQPV